MGIITASFTHDINNVLAIINENAGLLNDLIMMSQQGRPLDQERVGRIAGKIESQIRRAESMVKNMNTFSHSNDSEIAVVDLTTLLPLFLELTYRLQMKKGKSVAWQQPENQITLTTAPLFLLNLVWSFLDYLLGLKSGKDNLILTVEETNERIELVFSGLDDYLESDLVSFQSELVELLINKLQATISISSDSSSFVISLPKKCDIKDT